MSLICKQIPASELILWFKALKWDEKINSWDSSLWFHAHCAAFQAHAKWVGIKYCQITYWKPGPQSCVLQLYYVVYFMILKGLLKCPANKTIR